MPAPIRSPALLRLPALALALAAVLAGSWGCKQQRLKGACVEDKDCGDPEVFRCDQGTCLCRSNAACQATEICNPSGFCQSRVGCASNIDCPTGTFCDTTSRNCLTKGRCTNDLHCPAGQICDRKASLCVSHCKTDSDCPLSQVCGCSSNPSDPTAPPDHSCGCTATTQAGRDACALGVCTSAFCGGDAFCPYGQMCGIPDPAANPLPSCYSDYDPVLRPYCDTCVTTPGSFGSCGTGPNYCLIDTITQGTFCGVDCSKGQHCPNGYMCDDIIVVFQTWSCAKDSDCDKPGARSTTVCTTDVDCKHHGVCGKAPGATTGFCHGKCFSSEGGTIGFCSCVENADCAQDTCDATSHTCSITKVPCDPTVGCPQNISCVDFGTGGGCLIGRNCAPLKGLTCRDVK